MSKGSDNYEIVHKDDGCELHDSCLNCPEPICIHDFPGYSKSWSLFKQTLALNSYGYSVEKISEELGIRKSQVRKFLDMVIVTV